MTEPPRFDLTAPQAAAAFALLGERPASGPLSTLPPVDRAAAEDLLAESGLLTKAGRLTKAAATMFGVLAAPGRRITSTVVTSITPGAATSTFYAPAEGGPYVALAATESGFAVTPVETGGRAAVILANHLGLAAEPEPLRGDAVELTAAAWAVLAALADLDEPASMPGTVRRALGKKPGPVVEAFRTIGPAGAADPGSDGLSEAVNWLGGARLAIRQHDGKIEPTRQGRAVLRALRSHAMAGSLTVDHLTSAGPVRVVSLSAIRTPERLFFGVWHVDERGPVIALGEPGADEAADMIRSLIEAPNVAPARSAAGVSAGSRPPPSAASAPPATAAGANPQWLTYVIAAAIVVALVGAGIGLFGGGDASVAAIDTSTTSPATSTTAPSTTTTTAAPTTTAVPVTIPTTVPEKTTTTSSSTTTSSTSTTTTTTTTTTTLPPSIIDENFDGSNTAAVPLFGPGVMTSEVDNVITGDVANGVLEMTVFVGGFIPTMYPGPLPDKVAISFDFNPQPIGAGAGFGAVLLSEDPSDGALEHYVAFFVVPANGLATVLPWNGGFGAPLNVTIPSEAGFATNQWNSLRFVLSDGQIEIHLNDVLLTTWTGVTPVASGHFGPLIVGAASGDTMLVDNVLVEAAE